MIHGQLNLSDVMAKYDHLFREEIRRNIEMTDGVLMRHIKDMLAGLPAPPDPFWKEWQL